MPYKEKRKGLKYKPEVTNAGPSSVVHDLALLFIFLACAALPVYTIPSLSRPVVEFVSNVGMAALSILGLLVLVAVVGGVILVGERFFHKSTTTTTTTDTVRQPQESMHDRQDEHDDPLLDPTRPTPEGRAGESEMMQELARRRNVWKKDRQGEEIELDTLS